MIRNNLYLSCGPTILLLLAAASAASAASNITNSLTGFTGDSTQGTTQSDLNTAGFDVTDTVGAPITFDTSGAHFGTTTAGDSGRNYIRTNGSDYANVSFVAEVTWVTTNIQPQASYFGLGAGEYGSFKIADWGTAFSTAQLFQEINDPMAPEVFSLKNDNTRTTFVGAAATGLATGTNRLRLTYDWFQKTADFAIDVAYAGGPFHADVVVPPLNTLSLYGADGWPTEGARVYVGGDDGGTYKDLNVTVSTGSMLLGDFNLSGTITSADWAILRANQHTDLSNKTFSEAYFLGDLNADHANNHDDFEAFKILFDEASGAGAFVNMLAGVPEPSAFVLIGSAALFAFPVRRRAARRI